MIFTTEDGYTAACTGTLLEDGAGGSVIPYFLTAHHCIETQSVARTLVTYWDFERAECEGDNPTTLTQLTGGADLLATHSESDSSLLRLRRPPPPLDEETVRSASMRAGMRRPSPIPPRCTGCITLRPTSRNTVPG